MAATGPRCWTLPSSAAQSIAETLTSRQAAQGSDVVVLATPIGGILSTFEKLAPALPSGTLVTDTGSTKVQFVERARMIFGAEAGVRVLPGHPMAGKEHGGIENADADLFRDACG